MSVYSAVEPRSHLTDSSTGSPTDPFRYSVFGGVLASPIAFPELVAAPPSTPAHWHLAIVAGEPPRPPLALLGMRSSGIETYQLFRTPAGHRLEYSHAGTFDIAVDGSRIAWYLREGAPLELVRSIVLGPALAIALESAGVLCLHGSAVVVDGGAVAFVGPKHHGKSTLAAALTRAGARLIGDDLIAVDPGRDGAPALVRPGVASLRLWNDAATAVDVDTLCRSVIPGVKTTAAGFDDRALAAADAPLAAVYVLVPVRGNDDGSPAVRQRLPGAAAAVALARQTKLADSLIGLRAAGAQLAAAATVVSTTPVYTLTAVRDFAMLPALVDRILCWHRHP